MPPVVAAVAEVVSYAIGEAALAVGITVSTTTGWVAFASYAISTVAVSSGISALSRAIAKKPAGAGAASALDPSRTLNVRDAAGTRKLFVGSGRVGGNVVFIHQTGTNNEYTHVVIVHAANECSAFQAYQLNGEALTLDVSGNVTSPTKWAGLVRVKTHLGSSTQTADTDLVSECSSVWDVNHRLRGLCYSYVRYKTDNDVFSSGLPTYTVDIDGALCYDPRDASTAFSKNSALILRWYLTLDRNLGGAGVDSTRIDDTMVIAAANICDESISLAAGGTEKRYESSGIIDTASEPGQVVQDLCGAMAGICPFVSGQFRMRAGAHYSAVMDLTDADAVGPMNVDPRMSIQQACNGVKGVYVCPENDWQPSDFPPVKNDTYMAEDGGERIWQDIVLNFTTSGARAQRLSKIILERGRQDITHVFPCGLKALNLMPGDVVTRTSTRYGWSAKEFEVMTIGLFLKAGDSGGAPVLGVNLTLRETASGVWGWSAEETTVDLAANTNLVDSHVVPTPIGLSLNTVNFRQADGSITPRLHVQWAVPSDSLVTSGGKVHIEYKKHADSTWLIWTASLRGDAAEDYITDVLAGVDYDVRMRFENRLTVKGAYCATVTATVSTDTTPPAVPTSLAASGIIEGIKLSWANPSDSDFAGIDVFEQVATTPVPDGTTVPTAAVGPVTEWSRNGLAANVTLNYWIRSRDTTGNVSAWVGPSAGTSKLSSDSIAALISSVAQDMANIIAATNEHANALLQEAQSRQNAITSEQSTRNAADVAETSARTTADSTLQGNINTVSADLATEQTTRATAISALASDIAAMLATFNDSVASLYQEYSVRAAAQTSQAASITSLNASVGTLNSSVNILAAAYIVGGVAIATWGFKLGAGNKVVGMQAIAASGGTQADTSVIVFSGADLQSDNFVAGTSGWRVRYTGDAEFQNGIFRGTLKAGSSIEAGVAPAAGLGKASGSNSITSTTDTVITALQVTVTCDGQARKITLGGGSYMANSSGGTQSLFVSIYRDSTLLATFGNGGQSLAAGASLACEMSVNDTPSAGSHTFKIMAHSDVGNSMTVGGQIVVS
jgi:hypothetical protein